MGVINLIQFKNWLKKVKTDYGSEWKDIHNAIKECYEFSSYKATHEKIKGDMFEYICKYVLLKNNRKEVYLYNEIPLNLKTKFALRKCDKGIDGIYKIGSVYYAFQCKWREKEKQSIDKDLVGGFITEYKNHSNITKGHFITNVKLITKYHKDVTGLKWYTKSNINTSIDETFVDDVIKSIETTKIIKRERFTMPKLRTYQQIGITKLLENTNDRIKCIMACGTGKTLMMFQYYQNCKENKKVLFQFPSLQLVSQTYQKFKDLYPKKRILCICSQLDKYSLGCDETTDSEAQDIYEEYLLKCDVEYTTDPSIIKKHVKLKNIIVFSTYQSSHLLKDSVFDIGFYDEAHKTVNSKSQNNAFGFTLTDENCKINKRLFFTATPKYYKGENDNIFSMDDESIYGKIGYEYSFTPAIKDKYILDYQVGYYTSDPNYLSLVEEKYIKNLKKEDNLVETNDFISAFMIKKFIKEVKLKRYNILTYHNTVNKAKQFAKYLELIFSDYDIDGCIQTMSGKDSISTRKEKIGEFKKNNISVLCSSRVLNEGVDIPCVNIVVFVEPRKSTIDIVQCVGRGMRLHPENEKCHILLPIHYDNGIDQYGFKNIQQILSAMGTVDDKLVEYFVVKGLRTKKVKYFGNVLEELNTTNTLEPKFNIDEVEKALEMKIISRNEFSWEYKKNLLFEYCELKKKVPINKLKYKDVNIGTWLHHKKSEINSISHKHYKKLSKNIYVKKCLDNYLSPEVQWNRRKTFLFEYYENNKKMPKDGTIYDGVNIISWLDHQKEKISGQNHDYYKNFSKHDFFKESIDKYLIHREQNKQKIKLTSAEWIILLFEYCNENNKDTGTGETLTNTTVYKTHSLGQWFKGQKKSISKSKIKYYDHPSYKRMSKNKYVKELLDYSYNPPNDNIKIEQMKKILFDNCNKNKKTPFREKKGSTNTPRIGDWYHNIKKKITEKQSELYKSLSQNKYVKTDLDKYLKIKEQNKDKVNLSFDEWKDLIFKYCNEHNKVPTQTTSVEDDRGTHNIGGKLNKIKCYNITSKNDDYYKKLSVNKYVKKSLDDYLEYNKDEIWIKRLFEYCDVKNELPPFKKKINGHCLRKWLNSISNEIKSKDDELYKKLSKRKIIKEYLDGRFEEGRAWNEQKLWDKKKDELFKYCINHKNDKNPIPSQRSKNKDAKTLSRWYNRARKQIDNTQHKYYISFSENQIVKKDLDNYLSKK